MVAGFFLILSADNCLVKKWLLVSVFLKYFFDSMDIGMFHTEFKACLLSTYQVSCFRVYRPSPLNRKLATDSRRGHIFVLHSA